MTSSLLFFLIRSKKSFLTCFELCFAMATELICRFKAAHSTGWEASPRIRKALGRPTASCEEVFCAGAYGASLVNLPAHLRNVHVRHRFIHGPKLASRCRRRLQPDCHVNLNHAPFPRHPGFRVPPENLADLLPSQRTRGSPRALCPRLDFVSRSGRNFFVFLHAAPPRIH